MATNLQTLNFNSTIYLSILDVNECLTDPCQQLCDNTAGSFTCSCNAGFILSKDYVNCECKHWLIVWNVELVLFTNA